MKLIILALLVVSGNCQSAFESFMARNRDIFSNVAPSNFAQPQQQLAPPRAQPAPQWQAPQARSLAAPAPATFAAPANNPEPFVTSNSHIQAFNAPQGSGSPTTISGPNFQTSITLPALPPLPQHPPSSPAALAAQQAQPQNQQFSFQPQAQAQPAPQLTHQFSTQVHSHSASPAPATSSPFINRPASINSFFNPQANTNFNGFPFNFAAQQAPAPLAFPSAPSSSSLPAPRPLDFSSFQPSANFFTNPAQPQTQPASLPFGANAIRAPGFETFVFMQPSEQPVSGAGTLSKIIRSPNGIEKQMYFSPLPNNYSPPSVYSYSTVHSNPPQQPQQGQQQ